MIGPYWSLEISLKHLESIGFAFNTKKNHLSFIYSVWEKMMSFDQVLSEIMIIRRWTGEQIDRTLKNKCVYNSLQRHIKVVNGIKRGFRYRISDHDKLKKDTIKT